MERNSFIFYRSFYEALKYLPLETQGKLYVAIMEYALNGNIITIEDPVQQSIFTLIRPVLDNSLKQYNNGSKGGAPKGNRNASKKQPKNNPKTTQKQPNENPKQPEYNQDIISDKESFDEDGDKDVDKDKDVDDDKDKDEDVDGGTNTRPREDDGVVEKIQEILLQGIVDFYEKMGRRYVPDFYTETTATRELSNKVRMVQQQERWATDNDSTATFWGLFLKSAWESADEWQRNHFDIKTLNSQFNAFYNQIKNQVDNGKSTNYSTASGVRYTEDELADVIGNLCAE